MDPYTTSKSNLAPRNFDEETQRTGRFTATTTLRPGEHKIFLQALFRRVRARLEEATDDNRAYTVKIKMTADIAVEGWQAKIGEYATPDHFTPENPTLEVPSLGIAKRTFELTPQGYQRIE